ncbi:MAG: GtrA family protein [Bacteroidetes bacterium]|nr:GtrA family protein [Bacteroidota bacterium]
MKQFHLRLKSAILKSVDYFYPLFHKWMPLQTYRYAACGGSNMALNILIYFITYNFILKKALLHLGFITISPHIAAYIISFFITFPIGFYLSMYVVFPGSLLRRRVRLFRYFLVVIICVLLNYILLKIFVEHFLWYPTPSLMITTVIVVAFSYFSQRHFSFRAK